MLILRKPWDSQPQGAAEINRESWQARDLSLWYPLNGNTLDPVKNNLGTLNSGARFAASSRGLAAFFDGSDDYISWPSTTLGTGNSFTASAWVYYSGALGSRATVFGCENAATTFQLEVGGGAGGATTGGVTAIYTGVAVASTGNSVLAANTWTHIAYIKRGTGATNEFYINGVQTTSVTNNTNDYVETASVRTLGRRAAASQLFNGMIQDARINNFAMSAAQVGDLYRNGLELFAPRSIWVPVSVGAGGASSITAAAGASTASTLAASSTAASTPTAAAGTGTASTVAASSAAASAITSATGAATASTLTGSAVVAGAITAAAGVGTGGTLAGDTLAAGSAAIVAAGGVATTATLGGSSVAAADIGVAAGVATASVMGGPGAEQVTRMFAGGFPRREQFRKGYIIKGKRYWLTEEELAVMVAQMLAEISRGDIKQVTAGKPKTISKKTWDAIQVEARIEAVAKQFDDTDEDEDESILMML